MNDHSLAFLKRLLATPGPSGDEVAVGRIWRREAETFADRVYVDVRAVHMLCWKAERRVCCLPVISTRSA